MKTYKKWIWSLAFAVVMLNLSSLVHAKSNVTYSGSSGEFIFSPGSEQSPTNLFQDFQNVMPGDSITQQITVKNGEKKNVKIYLRSLGAQEESEEFLSQLKLTVKQQGKSKLYEGPADEAIASDWVSLGIFKPGAKINLEVTLDVPITMGNEFQNQAGYLEWEFQAEELPAEGRGPQTGDSYMLFLYISLGVVSIICIIVMVCRNKKSKKD